MPKKSAFPRLRVHIKRGAKGQVWSAWYWDGRPDGEKDTPLGSDYAEALKKWADLRDHKPRLSGTLQEAFNRWSKEVLPTYESAVTRRCYAQGLRHIEPVFGPATWDQVTPKTITGYLKKRTAKTQGNREMALLSVIWQWAVTEELVKTKFPLLGVRGWKNKEKPDNFYVTDAMFDALYKHAEPHLRDAMDLASATGMRVMDVIGLQITDHRGDVLFMRARKTDKPAPYDLTQSAILPALLERRRANKVPHFGVLTKPNGAQVTLRMLESAFVRARTKAVEECPEVAGMKLRYMRKLASRRAGTIEAASKLLQHSSIAVTAKHYPVDEKLRPTR